MYFWQNIVALSHLLFVGIHRVCVFVSSSIGVIVDACRGVYAWSEGTTWSYDLHFVFLFLLTSYTDRSRILFFFLSRIFFPSLHFWHCSLLNPECMFIPHIFSLSTQGTECCFTHTASQSVFLSTQLHTPCITFL